MRSELAPAVATDSGGPLSISVKEKVAENEDLLLNGTLVDPKTTARELFDNIRGYGGGLTRKISEINAFAKQISRILEDWDGEEEEDIEYDD